MTVFDYEGNSNSDDVKVTVIDTTTPEISTPSDIEYTEGETGNVITWIATDLNPSFYTIYRDTDLIVDSEIWYSDTPIIIYVDGLTEGIYTFVITVMDLAGKTAEDTVIVTVIPSVPELSSILSLLLLPTIMCVTLVVVPRRRRIARK